MFIVFLIAAILVVIGVICLVGAALGGGSEAGGAGGLFLVVGLVAILLSCITTIGTKDVGVVTTFGRPTGRDLENGLHWKAPWQSVTEMDGAIQPDDYSGDSGIHVRIGDSTTATVSAVIRWRIVPDQASVLYQDYRSDNVNETIRDSLVRTQFQAALNDVLGKYNPLSSVAAQAKAKAASGQPIATTTAPNLDEFSSDVKASMDDHLAAAAQGTKSGGAEQVRIVSVTINFLDLANNTQEKINEFQKEIGATRVAEQHESTTQAQARANRNLSKSVSKDPNVLVSMCFDTVEEAVKAGYTLPAGFSCWGGGGSAVVVPGGR